MKIIGYDERSEWNEFISEDTLFIRMIIGQLKAKTVLDIPCSNGRNLTMLHEIADFALFGDINKHMVKAVQDKIRMGSYRNCLAVNLDLCNLSTLPSYSDIDLILIMQQSFQLLDYEQAKTALSNIRRSGAKYVIIDIYDFLSHATDLPLYLIQDSHFTGADGTEWQRKSSLIKGGSEFVFLRHDYYATYDHRVTTLKLRNYARKEFVAFCEQYGFAVKDVFTSYNMSYQCEHGRTIVLLLNQ